MMTAMILGIDPKIDYAFKLLPGQEGTEALMIDVLNGVLQRPEGARVESVKILYPFNPKAAYDDKLSIVDVRARDQSGRLFNVEMRIFSEPSFASRIIYYAAHTFQQQLREGDDYEKLRPTISICFLNHVLFPEVADSNSVDHESAAGTRNGDARRNQADPLRRALGIGADVRLQHAHE